MKRGRALLREAAAAALAQAGYEGDPRLRGAARRILTRMADYLRSPLAQKPFIRQGNQHMLAAEAAPPSFYTVMMLAHMPLFRAEHHREMDALYTHLVAAAAPAGGGAARGQARRRRCRTWCLAICCRTAMPPMPTCRSRVYWLELMARLGFLKRNENWSKLFERFLEDRDREGVWHPHKGTGEPEEHQPVRVAHVSARDARRRRGALGRHDVPPRAHRSSRRPADRDPSDDAPSGASVRLPGRLAPEAMFPAGVPDIRARRVTLGRTALRFGSPKPGDPSAPPVLLLHGWGASIYMWRDVVRAARGRGPPRGGGGPARAWAVGQADGAAGLSPRADRSPRYASFWIAERWTSVDVVAQSMGGTIALELALRGDRTRGTARCW